MSYSLSKIEPEKLLPLQFISKNKVIDILMYGLPLTLILKFLCIAIR